MKPSFETTEILVRRARGGDAEAIEVLCGRLLPPLKSWARGKLPSESRSLKDTEDLVLEALVRSLSRLPETEPGTEGSFLAYVRQALHNQIIDEWRRAKSRPGQVEIDESHPDTGRSPLDESVDRDNLARYQEALGRLEPADQEIIVVRLEFEMSYADVARVTGHPTADAARMAYVRAMQRLATAMGKEG